MTWWTHLSLGDFHPVFFQLHGIRVQSEVVRVAAGRQDDGQEFVAVHIRNSYTDKSTVNVATCYVRPGLSPDEFHTSVQRSREQFADMFAKEQLGLAPPKQAYWLVSVSNPDDPSKRVQGLAVCDPDLPTTLVSSEFCDALGLRVAQSRCKALLRVLGKRFLAEVSAADMQILAAIGKDLIERAIAEGGDRDMPLDQLFLDASARAYAARRRSKAKTVLVTGSYSSEGLIRLRRIEAELFKCGYDPVLLIDYPDSPESPEAKLLSFAALSRFVVYEATFPSGGIDEFAIFKHNQEITAALHEEGRMATAMQSHYADEHKFIKFFPHQEADLENAVRRATEWAETIVNDRTKRYSVR